MATTPTLVIDGASLDITIRQGKTFKPRMKYKNPDGSLINLTGFTALWVARQGPAGSALFSLTQAAGITLGGTPFNIVAEIAASTTATWAVGKYNHELELLSPDGTSGLVTGVLKVLPEFAK